MKPYWKVTLYYLAFGVAWIFGTDWLVAKQATDMDSLTSLQTIKGWFYVALSALLIFHLTKRAFDLHLAEEREKQRVFRTTLSGAHHILLNYLNQMQPVTLDAEVCKDFPRETLTVARESSDQAAAALMKLETIEHLTADRIHHAVHGSAGADSAPRPTGPFAA